MTANKYKPTPIDTETIQLPEKLEDLMEQLARHVHDLWAQERIAQGWTYGNKRDDDQLTHPGLIEYDKLTEIEKDYDRNTAKGTLKAILKLGYKIIPPEEIE